MTKDIKENSVKSVFLFFNIIKNIKIPVASAKKQREIHKLLQKSIDEGLVERLLCIKKIIVNITSEIIEDTSVMFE